MLGDLVCSSDEEELPLMRCAFVLHKWRGKDGRLWCFGWCQLFGENAGGGRWP